MRACAEELSRPSGCARHEPDRVAVLARVHGLGTLGVSPAPKTAQLAHDRTQLEAIDPLTLERRAVAIGAAMPVHLQRPDAAAKQLALEVRGPPVLWLDHE